MVEYPKISLISVYDQSEPERSHYYRELYYLLGERKPEESISHKEMPSWQDHVIFVESKPYKDWFVVQNDKFQFVGSLYITHNNEIGIGIFEAHRGKRYASAAIYSILEFYKDETFFANINPENQKSIDLFSKFGFVYIQSTYRREPIRLDVLGAVEGLHHPDA